MTQYINKSALVAEIRKQMKIELGYGYTTEQRVVADAGKNLALRNLLFFLDTLEVKEVESMQENPCDGCTNKKGCVTCENGELRETVQNWEEVLKRFKKQRNENRQC